MELVWSDQAEIDLYDIADWYDRVETGLSDAMFDRIVDAPLILLERPRLGQPVGTGSLRKWPVRRTPFVLLYRVEPATVEVARVVHGASDWEKSL